MVIMAGGSGTRLWPLSRKGTPKQLLNLFEGKSLLRLAFERSLASVPAEQILVVTGADQAGLTALPLPAGLPEVRIAFPFLPGLAARQATSGSVLSLPEVGQADAACAALAEALGRT